MPSRAAPESQVRSCVVAPPFCHLAEESCGDSSRRLIVRPSRCCWRALFCRARSCSHRDGSAGGGPAGSLADRCRGYRLWQRPEFSVRGCTRSGRRWTGEVGRPPAGRRASAPPRGAARPLRRRRCCCCCCCWLGGQTCPAHHCQPRPARRQLKQRGSSASIKLVGRVQVAQKMRQKQAKAVKRRWNERGTANPTAVAQIKMKLPRYRGDLRGVERRRCSGATRDLELSFLIYAPH